MVCYRFSNQLSEGRTIVSRTEIKRDCTGIYCPDRSAYDKNNNIVTKVNAGTKFSWSNCLCDVCFETLYLFGTFTCLLIVTMWMCYRGLVRMSTSAWNNFLLWPNKSNFYVFHQSYFMKYVTRFIENPFFMKYVVFKLFCLLLKCLFYLETWDYALILAVNKLHIIFCKTANEM